MEFQRKLQNRLYNKIDSNYTLVKELVAIIQDVAEDNDMNLEPDEAYYGALEGISDEIAESMLQNEIT
jgi:hypothetical protein